MSDTPTYISRVEIKNLWDRYDLVWDLNPDVNVLSGTNGSGKSTILNSMAALLTSFPASRSQEEAFIYHSDLKISIGNGFIFQLLSKTERMQDPVFSQRLDRLNDDLMLKFGSNDPATISYKYISYKKDHMELCYMISEKAVQALTAIQVDLISNFDTAFKPSEAIEKLSDKSVVTELDWQIYHLQNKYIKYQLHSLRKAKSSNTINQPEITRQYSFFDMIDSLFQETGKQIDRNADEILFNISEQKISPYQLSTGEKQLLIILLTVLVQDNKPSIMFLDEPEISLHFDWQRKLIEYIRTLNPNVQLIIATHSPAMIMDGWMDKVANVSDLITLDRKAAAQNA